MSLLRALAKCLVLALLAVAGVAGSLLWLELAGPRSEPPVPVASGPVREEPAPAPVPGTPTADAETVESTEGPDPLPLRPKASIGHQQGLHRVKDGLGLTASSALAVDAESGVELFAKNPDAVLPIASLTKLMTALVLTEAKLPLTEGITITDEDVDRERNSRSRLRVGTTLTRAEALQLALMSSENRAAHALARSFPGGVGAFVAAMNTRARALGMDSTQFEDPTGLSEGNRSTVRDLARLARAAAREPLIRTYSTTTEHRAEFNGRALRYLNSNRLVKNPDWDIQLQKTGYIVEAGRCVLMQARIDGRPHILVVLDAGSRSSQSADAERLRRRVASLDGDIAARQQAAAQRPAKG
ncbi:MAG: serine hydrolase [Burkholderiales bacterium]|nr:serine hydrolase [Burkholderiales bacterium]